MNEPTYIERRRDGDVEYLVLNRPDVRNALNEDMIAEVAEWARRTAADPQVRAVVIAGTGPSFCAGADLAWMTKMAGYTRDDNVRDARDAAAMFEAIDTLPVPVIARVHGAAIGGGAGLVAVADIALADESATFGFTEVKLGLLPAIIAPYVLAKIGMSAARELFVTGRRFHAERAREIGLVHAVVATDQLDRTVQQYLVEILANGREAMSAAKTLLRQIANRPVDAVTPLTTEAIAMRRVSEEAQERMRAFLKKK
ncbi:MAG TPA: enoyl-CoA hydratase-related protein [Vicinamibacterales bacterium]|nr:enoyl-CoA hydratase-related protein [Vicinamibacterales bacterium]